VAIIVSDLQGRQLLNTRLPFGGPLPPMLPMERELRARFGNEVTLISDVYQPPAALGPHSFAIQVPVRRNGEVVQLLTMASFANQLQQLLAEQRLPAGWHASIVDRSGVVAARSLEADKYVGQPVRQELALRLQAAEEGFHQGLTLAGVPGTAFFSRSPHSRWTFLVSVPDAALHGAAVRAVALMSSIWLVLLGLGLLAALLVGQRIARPIEALRLSAERLGRGEPVHDEPSGTLEVDAAQAALAQASAQRRQAQGELEQRVAEALASYEQSQRALLQAQKLEALGRLTGGIAHDFNNVLQTLTTGLQAARRTAPAEFGELLSRCQRAVARGTGLARQLTVFGRVQEVRAQTIDTGLRLADVRPLLQGALPSNVELRLDIPAGLWPVTVDPAQLELALLNLVMNARDAMPGGGRMVLRGSNRTLGGERPDLCGGDYVMLSLADTGEGMSEEVIAHAMDPFYTTKGVGKGTGLGLATVYGIVKQSGGAVTVRSRPGDGTTFTVFMPAVMDGVVTPPEPVQPRVDQEDNGSETVLLVEDEPSVRRLLARVLGRAGYHVLEASNGIQALEVENAFDGPIEAVITDVIMPEMGGVELVRVLQRSRPGLTVLFVSGYTRGEVLEGSALTDSRCIFMSKPFSPEQLVAALRDALDQRVTPA